MLIREGDDRSPRLDVGLAGLFASIAGALNAAGFQAAGLFSANMTGNASALSDYLGLQQWSAAGLAGLLIVMFIAGATISGFVIEAGHRRGVGAKYALGILLEGAVVLTLGIAEFVWGGQLLWLLIAGLSLAMGIQNAATTRISNARVRTTHVSGMATDIGLGLAALAYPTHDRREALGRLHLYTVTLTAFVLGGVIGVAVYLALGSVMMMLAGVLLMAIATVEIVRARKL